VRYRKRHKGPAAARRKERARRETPRRRPGRQRRAHDSAYEDVPTKAIPGATAVTAVTTATAPIGAMCLRMCVPFRSGRFAQSDTPRAGRVASDGGHVRTPRALEGDALPCFLMTPRSWRSAGSARGGARPTWTSRCCAAATTASSTRTRVRRSSRRPLQDPGRSRPDVRHRRPRRACCSTPCGTATVYETVITDTGMPDEKIASIRALGVPVEPVAPGHAPA
jgi:hypothetical protein